MEKASPPPQQLACPSTTVLSLSTTLFIDRTPLCEIKKVTASQDDDFVGACNIAVWMSRKDERAKNSQALATTKEEHILMESGYRRRFSSRGHDPRDFVFSSHADSKARIIVRHLRVD